jgi:hypothetical protein
MGFRISQIVFSVSFLLALAAPARAEILSLFCPATSEWGTTTIIDVNYAVRSECVVEFAVRQQSRIGRDHGPTKLQHQAAVEIELVNPVF